MSFHFKRSTPALRKVFGFAVLNFAVIFAGSLDLIGQERFPREVLSPEVWESVTFDSPEECDGSPVTCSKRFLKPAGISLAKGSRFKTYRLGEREGRNLVIVFVSVRVNDDDSITGIRYRLAMSLGDVEDRTYKLESLGQQFTCARGHKYWSKARCP